MSGKIIDNVTRSSGTIAPTTGGLSWESAVITASTVTVESNRGYYINTTSNACTVTLPSSAEIGDQIILVDYARTFATNNLIIDSNGNNFQGSSDAFTVDYTTNAQSISIVFSDSTKGWIPVSDDAVVDAPVEPQPTQGIIAYGYDQDEGARAAYSQKISSSGVVAAEVTGVGSTRRYGAGSSYGGDKGIFAYGEGASNLNISNLVSNSGVIAADGSAVGTARYDLAATPFGVGEAIFAYGYGGGNLSLSNKVNSSGVVAADVTGVGTARAALAGVRFGGDKGIFAYGFPDGGSLQNVSNKVSNTGVVASDTSGVGTARKGCRGASYGIGKAAIAFGFTNTYVSMKNLVSDTGVVAADVTGVGTGRVNLAACGYGGDKGIFAKGGTGDGGLKMTNLLSNTGVIASDTTGVGPNNYSLTAANFSYS
jgi:hypothetical protein